MFVKKSSKILMEQSNYVKKKKKKKDMDELKYQKDEQDSSKHIK